MKKFSSLCEAIAGTTKKLVKISLVADYMKLRTADESAISAVFLSGRPFPVWEEGTLQVGGRSLWRIVAELAGRPESDLTAAYRRLGDLGAVAGELLPDRPDSGLEILEVEREFRRVAAARAAAEKVAVVRHLLSRASSPEAKYIVKIMTGNLRIGLKESLVEEAVAKAYSGTVAEVQRSNMLLGDIGETLHLAAIGRLSEAKMRLFHPLGFMLASPVESTEEGLSYFTEATVEDKYDGIRAQAHVSGNEVKIFSRTRDEITESFPELPPAFAGLPQDAIFDGEIVAWQYPERREDTAVIVDEEASGVSELKAKNLGSARPFSELQQRLGRKKVSEKMIRENAVAFLAFDILYAGRDLLIERSLDERAHILDSLLAAPRDKTVDVAPLNQGAQGSLSFEHNTDTEQAVMASIIRAPAFRAETPEELEELFIAARGRGNEGLMIKDISSPYTPGKRGKSWLKMKRELATLDVVVTAAEYGHGKRIGVLSDYTFAVWDGDRLVNIGKAYSGLTDQEIAEMTKWFLEHTLEDEGFRRKVEPKIVLEVAFNNMMRSDRHESGYALRFPRIIRLRRDKSPEEADNITTVKKVFDSQTAGLEKA